jgi:hypothetical protein
MVPSNAALALFRKCHVHGGEVICPVKERLQSALSRTSGRRYNQLSSIGLDDPARHRSRKHGIACGAKTPRHLCHRALGATEPLKHPRELDTAQVGNAAATITRQATHVQLSPRPLASTPARTQSRYLTSSGGTTGSSRAGCGGSGSGTRPRRRQTSTDTSEPTAAKAMTRRTRIVRTLRMICEFAFTPYQLVGVC